MTINYMNNRIFTGKYVLDWEKLKSCDIILSRESWSADAWLDWGRCFNVLKSGVIRLGSKDYSHAMLYFEGSIIHAHPPMVFASNPQRFCAANEGDYRCLRCSGLTEKQKRQIESYARANVGALYSPWEAAKTPLKKRGHEHGHLTSGKEFCSRFVAQAYSEAGISLVPNPSYCAPGDFLEAGNLQDMGYCTRNATEEDFIVLASRDFTLVAQNRTAYWLDHVRALARQDGFEIKTLNSVYEYILAHKDRDEEVEKLLLESQYIDTWKEDADVHENRFSPIGFISLLNTNPKIALAAVGSLFDCVGRYGDMLIYCEKHTGKLRTMVRLTDLYRDMINNLKCQLTVLIAFSISKPGVGPLTRLATMCSHLTERTYEQYYQHSASTEANKLKEEWTGGASEWRSSVVSVLGQLFPRSPIDEILRKNIADG